MSLDCGLLLGQNVRMAESETETEYKQAFMRRIAEARVALGWKQWQMAEALGMPQDKYKQYESRSLLPHHLVRRFCLIARVDMEWLMTGQGKMKLAPLPEITPDIKPEPRVTKTRRPRKKVA
jgi:transcriptional regulator with XRE-family HTH domain